METFLISRVCRVHSSVERQRPASILYSKCWRGDKIIVFWLIVRSLIMSTKKGHVRPDLKQIDIDVIVTKNHDDNVDDGDDTNPRANYNQSNT